MKKSILLISLLFPLFLTAQKKAILIGDTHDGNTIVLTAKNKVNTDQKVEMILTSVGFGLEPETIITEVVLAKSNKEIARITPLPDKKWSYSYSVKYKTYRRDSEAASAETTTATIAAIPGSGKITVFTKDGCGRSELTVKHLKKNKIAYKDLDITKSKKNNALLSEKLLASGFKGGSFVTPAIMVGDEMFYDIENLQGFLQKLAVRK